ncbi:MAG: alpha/beta hydrolase [Cyanobacteriota bacterium]
MQVIAMHGWCGDSRGWAPWHQAAEARGWTWQSGERGYGALEPHSPVWRPEAGPRTLIVHSLGLHLLPATVLARAEAVVLLASFAAFVPTAAAGRRLRTALRGMESALEGPEAPTMLRQFLTQASFPEPLDRLSPGPGLEPLSEEGRRRLLADLRLLAATSGLPPGFPTEAAVLIVEAGLDRIVVPEARAALRQQLPLADVWLLAEEGHCLLGNPPVQRVLDWMGQER